MTEPGADELGPETVTQDAIRAGLTHLHVRCHRCGQSTSIPWNMLPDMLSALLKPVGSYAGRLRCSRCKYYPPRASVTAWAQNRTRPYQASGLGGG